MKQYYFEELDIPETSGIYFLYGAKDELLYIGKSVNLKSRLNAHFKKLGSSNLKHLNITLNKFSIMFADEERLDYLEKQMIAKYSPSLNKSLTKQTGGIIKVTYEIEEQLHDKLKMQAIREKRKVSELAEQAFRQFLSK
jgi:excinuclease UvrABC nuclease subunit